MLRSTCHVKHQKHWSFVKLLKKDGMYSTWIFWFLKLNMRSGMGKFEDKCNQKGIITMCPSVIEEFIQKYLALRVLIEIV